MTARACLAQRRKGWCARSTGLSCQTAVPRGLALNPPPVSLVMVAAVPPGAATFAASHSRRRSLAQCFELYRVASSPHAHGQWPWRVKLLLRAETRYSRLRIVPVETDSVEMNTRQMMEDRRSRRIECLAGAPRGLQVRWQNTTISFSAIAHVLKRWPRARPRWNMDKHLPR